MIQYEPFETSHREDNTTKLGKMQATNLDPVVEYVHHLLKYRMTMNHGIATTKLTSSQRDSIKEYINKYNNWKLLSVEFATSNLKSAALAIALMNNKLTVEEALDLSRLEENYQLTLFGEVEGSHDLDEATSRMNIAAAKNLFNLS